MTKNNSKGNRNNFSSNRNKQENSHIQDQEKNSKILKTLFERLTWNIASEELQKESFFPWLLQFFILTSLYGNLQVAVRNNNPSITHVKGIGVFTLIHYGVNIINIPAIDGRDWSVAGWELGANGVVEGPRPRVGSRGRVIIGASKGSLHGGEKASKFDVKNP